MNNLAKALPVLLLATLAGCGGVRSGGEDGAPAARRDVSSVADAVPRAEPRSRYGNPASYVVRGKRYHTLDSARGYRKRGIASWYGTKFHGRLTSNREPYDMYAMTAAHKSLPLPSYVRVTNLNNGRQVVVRVNDRGPFHANRVIDLSYAAATKLDIVRKGTALVEVEAMDPGAPVRQAGQPAPAVSAHNVFVQVGAFANRANAVRMKTRLDGLSGQRVFIMPASSGGGTVYRVRLGPLADVDAVDRLTLSLAGLGIHDPQVVVD